MCFSLPLRPLFSCFVFFQAWCGMSPKKLPRKRSSNVRRRRAGGAEVVAHTLLTEPCSQATKKRGPLLSEDHTAVFAAAAAAVLANAIEAEDGSAAPLHPDDAYASQVFFDIASSRSLLQDPRNMIRAPPGHHLHRLRAGGVRPEHDTGFWRRIAKESDAFRLEFLQLLLHSSITALGGNCPPVCLSMT